MKLKPLILVPAAVAALALAGCSSDDSSNTAETVDPTTCPTAAPDSTKQADWTLRGASGSLDVVGSTKTTAPRISVSTPFSVAETTVKTLSEGSGDTVESTTTVYVCYVGVNGRTGKTFDSSFESGQAVPFAPSGVVPGFTKALVGQKIGSTVAVAMTSQDGYATGNPDAGIEVGDTLVFALQINGAA